MKDSARAMIQDAAKRLTAAAMTLCAADLAYRQAPEDSYQRAAFEGVAHDCQAKITDICGEIIFFVDGLTGPEGGGE